MTMDFLLANGFLTGQETLVLSVQGGTGKYMSDAYLLVTMIVHSVRIETFNPYFVVKVVSTMRSWMAASMASEKS